LMQAAILSRFAGLFLQKAGPIANNDHGSDDDR